MPAELNQRHFDELCAKLDLVDTIITHIADLPALQTKKKWVEAIIRIQDDISYLYDKVGTKGTNYAEMVEERVVAEIGRRLATADNLRRRLAILDDQDPEIV